MDLVDETLRDWRRHPHQYGVNDCVLSSARYFLALGSLGKFPWFAGTYSDADEAAALMDKLGGMEAIIEMVGGTPVEGDPQRGDIIGLVADTDYVIPSLCTGDSVAARLEHGVYELRLKFVRWRGVWRGVS